MPKRPIRVLILDDDQAFGGMIRDYLDITTDCQIDVIETDSQLWPLLSENSYDLMFLDYQLKQTTGLEVLAQIKEQRYQIPIVMMTGQGSEKVASDAFKLGAMEYLVKGDFPFALLPELVRKAVRSQRMQRAMRRSLDKIRYQATLLDNVRDALVVWDSRGHITYWNRTAEELYRKLSGDVLGRTAEHAYFSLFSPPMRLADLTGEPRQINERRLAHPDSQETWISSIISPLRDESGQAIGFMDVTRDITHIKQIETRIQLRLAGEQLLAGVSSLFISTPASEEEPVFCEVIERVVGFIGAQTGALLVNHNGTLRCLCVVANQRGDRRVSNCSFDLNDPQYAPLRDYADRRELTFIPGLEALGSFGDDLRANLSTDEQSLILLPLLVRDRLIGMLFLGFPPNQVQWEEEHRHLLVTFGSILASVLLQIRTDQDLRISPQAFSF
ncbi:MAG: response regulator, partial [Anaerolineae bacterium]|nr:response regulator [Anaerolineae bacterium]